MQVHDFEVLLSRLGAHHRLCAWLPKSLSDTKNGLGSTELGEYSLSDSCETHCAPTISCPGMEVASAAFKVLASRSHTSRSV